MAVVLIESNTRRHLGQSHLPHVEFFNSKSVASLLTCENSSTSCIIIKNKNKKVACGKTLQTVIAVTTNRGFRFGYVLWSKAVVSTIDYACRTPGPEEFSISQKFTLTNRQPFSDLKEKFNASVNWLAEVDVCEQVFTNFGISVKRVCRPPY